MIVKYEPWILPKFKKKILILKFNQMKKYIYLFYKNKILYYNKLRYIFLFGWILILIPLYFLWNLGVIQGLYFTINF